MPDSANKPLNANWTAMPKQMIPVANLLTPQLEVAAAVSVASAGIATQMWGLWAAGVARSFDLSATTRRAFKEAPIAPQLDTDVDTLKTIIREKTGAPKAPRIAKIAKTDAKPPVPAAEVVRVTAPIVAKAAAVATDDLKKISGVGPKLEQVLNAMEIRSYAQIAGWTEADITKVDDQLKLSGRISRDDWVGQSTVLLKSSGGQ